MGMGWTSSQLDLTQALCGEKVNYVLSNGFAGVCAWQVGDLVTSLTDPRLVPSRDAALGHLWSPAPLGLAVTSSFPALVVHAGAGTTPLVVAAAAVLLTPSLGAATSVPVAVLAGTSAFPLLSLLNGADVPAAVLTVTAAFAAAAVSTGTGPSLLAPFPPDR